MELYYIEEKYINYLRQFDLKVADNKKGKRPYIGIIFKINNLYYFAPLSSPKAKHLKMKKSIDLYKIKDGKYGVININNMIPVPIDEVKEIIFNKVDDLEYRKLLEKQIKIIIRDTKMIRINEKIKKNNFN